MIYPWQVNEWNRIMHTKQENRLPHALLLTGLPGIGKKTFANSLVKSLLCLNPMSQPYLNSSCGDCHSCALIVNKSHQNVMWIEPEEEGKAIKIDQIREVNEFVNQSKLQGGYSVIVIHPANEMNVNAANALLKTLEEPSKNTLFILISDQSKQLSATIRSRCQCVNFNPPPHEEALTWLEHEVKDKTINQTLLLRLAHGAPLLALQYASDEKFKIREALFQAISQPLHNPIHFAVQFKEIPDNLWFDYFIEWMMDLLRLQLGAEISNIINVDFEAALKILSEKTNHERNIKLLEYLQRLKIQMTAGINFNKQLLLESVFLKWMECHQ